MQIDALEPIVLYYANVKTLKTGKTEWVSMEHITIDKKPATLETMNSHVGENDDEKSGGIR